jgi:5-methylcytosine-specific restriction endonuclease McrA
MKRNPEKAREAVRRWRARNPELLRERNRKYRRAARLRNGAKLNAQRAAYLASHPEVKRAKEQAYRARRIAAEGSFTGAEWLELVARWGDACAYDGAPGPLEPDHRVPLRRGGTNYIENIVPACRNCNGRKHTMTEDEFRARLSAERTEMTQRTIE